MSVRLTRLYHLGRNETSLGLFSSSSRPHTSVPLLQKVLVSKPQIKSHYYSISYLVLLGHYSPLSRLPLFVNSILYLSTSVYLHLLDSAPYPADHHGITTRPQHTSDQAVGYKVPNHAGGYGSNVRRTSCRRRVQCRRYWHDRRTGLHPEAIARSEQYIIPIVQRA